MRVGLGRERRERRVVSQDECEVDSVLWCLCVVLNKLFFFPILSDQNTSRLFLEAGACHRRMSWIGESTAICHPEM